MRKLFLLCIVVSFAWSCNKADDDVSPVASPNTQEEFESYLSDVVEDQNIAAMSVLLFKGADIKYERYIGVSDKNTGAALNSSNMFLLASISKTVTATALMQLYEQGKFGLDDKINDHLPFTVKVPGRSTDITFRMLLMHTSAIADGAALDGQYYDNRDSPVPLSAFMQDYLTVGGKYYNATDNFHNFEPGTKHEYSNVGSALIGVLVEQLSGMDFNSYCKQHIFIPLGMNNTYWRLDEAPVQQIVHPYDGDTRLEHYTFTDYPNGGLRSTAQDMFRFLSAYSNSGAYGTTRVLKEATVREMLRVQNSSIDNTAGLHWFVMNTANNIWGHDGGEKGVATIMGFNPDNKTGAIIFTNQGDADLDNVLVTAYNYAVKL